MQINVYDLMKEVYDQLMQSSEQDKLRAEGIAIFSHKLQDAVQAAEELAKKETSEVTNEVSS